MIQFKTVRFKNFISSGNSFTEIYLNKEINTLIVGENGAGKSTMMDAITFSLFGKPYRNINKPQLVNSINKKECLVEIEFRAINKNYMIRRGIKPNIFEIYCDGELVDQDASSKDYQDFLEKNILRFNYKAFTQIVILGSSSFIPFMRLSPADRRTIIEDLLDIRVFSIMNTLTKDKLSLIKNDIAQTKRNTENILSQIELQKKYIEDTKKNNEEIVEAKYKDLEENEKIINSYRGQKEAIEKEVEILSVNKEEQHKVERKLNEFNKLETMFETNISKLKSDIKFFDEHSTCPTCDQHLNNRDEKILEYEGKIHAASDALKMLYSEQKRIQEKHNYYLETMRKISNNLSEISKIESLIIQAQKYASRLSKEIHSLESKKNISDDIKEISVTLLNQLEETEKQKRLLNEEKMYVETALLLLKDNGIKSRIIKQYIPVINKMVNKYLSAMNFFVNFEINEEFKETIKSRYRDDFSYENFSEGEKLRIDLALLFTWRAIAKIKNSMNTNLLILDEVFDSSLDSAGTEDFMKLLQAFGNEINVFVISHKGDVLIDKFKHILKFEKYKNFSRLVV